MKIPIDISNRQIADLIISALEGGINYPHILPDAKPVTLADHIRYVLRQHPETPMAVPDIFIAVNTMGRSNGRKFMSASVSQTLCNMVSCPTSGIHRVRHGWYKAPL